MKSKQLIDELIETLKDEKQKKLIELFKGKYTMRTLKELIEKNIEDDLNEA